MNKSHVIIMIETEDRIKFGGYIEKEIDEIDDINRKIQDPNIFLFSFKDNELNKYDILKEWCGFELKHQKRPMAEREEKI